VLRYYYKKKRPYYMLFTILPLDPKIICWVGEVLLNKVRNKSH